MRLLVLFFFFSLSCSDGTTGGQNPTNGQLSTDGGIRKSDFSSKKDLGKKDLSVAKDTGVDKDSSKQMEDMAPPKKRFVRFIAIGDQGEGNQTQRDIGQSMGKICDALGGCDFALLLGDNFYDSGVDSVTDGMFMTHFVQPYSHLDFPFYAVLGNHDLGGDGLGISLDRKKGEYQIKYSEMNPKWKMPAKHYAFTADPVFFVGLDTTDIFFRGDDAQERDIPEWVKGAGDKWTIAFGHHPYISNGKHGNAGKYDGVKFLPIANGKYIKKFVEKTICGKYDFYLAGHDHSRQDLKAKCGTEFLVSGAGAKTTLVKDRNPKYFHSDKPGFLLMEATPSTMKIQFYDKDGKLEHTRMVTK